MIKIQSLVSMFSRCQVVHHIISLLIQRLINAKSLQQRAVNWFQHNVINRAAKVDDTNTLVALLISGWFDDTMNGGTKETSSEKLKCFADVDNERVRKVFYPLPLVGAIF